MWEDSVFYYEKDFQEKFDELMEVAFKLKSRIIWEIGDDAEPYFTPYPAFGKACDVMNCECVIL